MRTIKQPWHIEMTPALSAIVERGIQFLSDRMPDQIRAPDPGPAPQTTAVDPKQRNRRIRELVLRDGMPSQWVAWHVGLSVSQVNRIVNRQEEAA